MSKEELYEDGKLLAAKSWFTRSASSITLQNASVEAAPDEVSCGIPVSKEGAAESGAGFTSLRQQLSMRRSMGSGEIKKETGAGSPSMTVKNVTPLTPLTPLKWKSNVREQEEEEKAMERSRLGSAVPVGTIYEKYPEGKPDPDYGKDERPAEGQQTIVGVANDRTNSAEELFTKTQARDIDEFVSLESLEGPDRKTSLGDDVMTMTIEFLRARLLSERSASKTAKLQIQQLAKKVSELEEKLDQALKDQKKAEVFAQEAFMKLKLAESSNQGMNKTLGEVSDRLISTSAKDSPLLRSRASQEDMKYLQQDISNIKNLSRTYSYGSSVEDRDSCTKGSLSETVNKTEELSKTEQGQPDVRPVPLDMSERSQEFSPNQESRAVIESRLRNMWCKISEDMTALAEERREDTVRKELMSWMGNVPAVLQNIVPKELVSFIQDVDLRSESGKIGPHGVPGQTAESQSELSPATVLHHLEAEAKRTVLLSEQFIAQENVQREWERNYQECQRPVEKLKGDTLNGSSSPNSSASHQEFQLADNWHGPNGVIDNSSFPGPHFATLDKSRSTVDLSTRSNGYNSNVNSPHCDEPHVELDPWTRDRQRRLGVESRHHDPTYQNTLSHGRLGLDPTNSNRSRVHHDSSAASSTRLAEDGYQSPKPDFMAGESSWDDKDRRHIGSHQQAQPRDGDATGRIERNNYFRVNGIEESYSSSQPESTHRHRHRRSHSDNSDWPAVEDYGLLHQSPELSHGFEGRQSYSGHPAAMAGDPRRTSFSKPLGSYEDLCYVDERMYGANERRRNSFPAAKVTDSPGQLNSTQISRNGHTIAEPTLSLGYGPAYDAPPREDSPVQQSPKAGLNKNISDVLRALQLAKVKIQNGGAGSIGQRPVGTMHNHL